MLESLFSGRRKHYNLTMYVYLLLRRLLLLLPLLLLLLLLRPIDD